MALGEEFRGRVGSNAERIELQAHGTALRVVRFLNLGEEFHNAAENYNLSLVRKRDFVPRSQGKAAEAAERRVRGEVARKSDAVGCAERVKMNVRWIPPIV